MHSRNSQFTYLFTHFSSYQQKFRNVYHRVVSDENCYHLSEWNKSIGGCSSPSPRPWACRWRTTNVCDAWPVRRQTYGYLPSCMASPPIGWYQIILLGDRGTCVFTTFPGLHSIAERSGFEPATGWSQVRHPNHSATEPHMGVLYILSAVHGCR